MMVLEMNQRLRYETLATGKTHEFSWEEMDNQMETFKEEAYRLVKTDLVLKGIIEAEQLEVSKEELEEEVRAIAARHISRSKW